MLYSDITEKIIACSYKVYNALGFGFLESVYEKSLLVELAESGLSVSAQYPIQVHYQKVLVGEFIADLFVEECVLVELKSIRTLSKIHEAQLVNYLVATDTPVGLLINFGYRSVEVKRRIQEL